MRNIILSGSRFPAITPYGNILDKSTTYFGEYNLKETLIVNSGLRFLNKVKTEIVTKSLQDEPVTNEK